MKKFPHLIVLVALCNIGNAQNLVSNGGFEVFSTIPTSSGQIVEADGWKTSGGSPDYFHEYASVSSGVNIPHTFAGYLNKAHEGHACAGISSFMKGWTNFREYLVHKLDTPLKAGQFYDISLYCLSNTSPVYYGGLSCDNFGLALSTKKLHKSPDGIVHFTPQCVVGSQLYAYTWKKISFQLYADSAYKYITIGSFVNDSVQQRQLMDTALLFECVYTFIDDVSITLTKTSTAIDELQNRKDNITTYTDILGRPVPYQKGLLIARRGNKCEKIYVR